MNTQVNDPKGAAGALKAPLQLIPPYALEQTAWVHKFGAERYEAYNWRKTGVCATTYVSAIMRHLNAWRDGEDLDPESGISHIAHIASSCNILLDAGHCGTLQDDRNKKPPVPKAEAVKDEPVALDQRVLPIPSEWDLPPVPEGYDCWVYRGTFKGEEIRAKGRFIAYSFRGADWRETSHFSAGYHHIEAIKDESVAPYGLPPYPPVPEGYTRWVYRGKGLKSDRRIRFASYGRFDTDWVTFPFGCTVGYESTHYIEAVK